MEKITYVILLVVAWIIFSFTQCTKMSVHTDQDHEAKFVNYQKYAWSPQKHIYQEKNQKFDNDIIERKIQTLVMNELNKRGLQLDTANPDIILDFDIMTEKKVKQESIPTNYSNPYYYGGFSNYGGYRFRNNFYNYGGWNNYYGNGYGYGYNMGYRTVNINYLEGTLIIDIVDAAANKLVWKGYAIGELTDPKTFSDELEKDIHKMFKKYPVKTKK